MLSHEDMSAQANLILSKEIQGRALFDTGSRKVPKTSGLDPGTYTFYFAVDMIMNGAIEVGKAYYDMVKVIITPKSF
jgi:hypothetical protein